MSDENLELWEKVEKTDPNYTKKANVGGNRITAIGPQYQIKQATEQFGTYGRTWGFKEIKLDYSLALHADLVVFTGVFYYPKGDFPIINSIKLYKDNAKTKIDDDFAKKIETDALTKALSKLGFNADVFMGRFDDERYVSQLIEEFSDPQTTEKLELSETDKEWVEGIQAGNFKLEEIEDIKYRALIESHLEENQ